MFNAPWHLVVREWVISLSLPLFVVLVVIFGANVFFGMSAGRDWRRSLWFQACTALFVVAMGVMLRNYWVFDLLHGFLYHNSVEAVENRWWIDAFAGVLTVIGSLCAIRVFTPDEWNASHPLLRPWIMAAIATLFFVLIVHS